VRVDEIVPIAKKPSLQIKVNDLGLTEKKLRKIEFFAIGQTELSKSIEFFAWDFNYTNKIFNPEIMLDKTGKQINEFKAGEYNVAVKVIDSEGLENIEIIKLKINGVVQVKDKV
jgi:hypothetical protein